MTQPADMAIHAPSRTARSAVDRVDVMIDRSVLFAGHAECPKCHAFVKQITRLGKPSVAGELVAGWCSVCCTTTYFASA